MSLALVGLVCAGLFLLAVLVLWLQQLRRAPLAPSA